MTLERQLPLSLCVWGWSLSCVQLYDPMDCSQPGSSVQGILQARVLEWVALSLGLYYMLTCTVVCHNYRWHKSQNFQSCITELMRYMLSCWFQETVCRKQCYWICLYVTLMDLCDSGFYVLERSVAQTEFPQIMANANSFFSTREWDISQGDSWEHPQYQTLSIYGFLALVLRCSSIRSPHSFL